MLRLALFLVLTAFAATAQTKTTEVELETGASELQLSNGVLIALSPGVDLKITHAADGTPLTMEVRKGAAQVMTSFGDPSGMTVQIGGSELTFGAGTFVLQNQAGGFSLTLLHGASPTGLPPLTPGQQLTVGDDGSTSLSTLNADEMFVLRRLFAKPPLGENESPAAPDDGGVAADETQQQIEDAFQNEIQSQPAPVEPADPADTDPPPSDPNIAPADPTPTDPIPEDPTPVDPQDKETPVDPDVKDPPAEDPKKEDPKKEEPKKDDPKKDEPKKEDPKTDPKKEEPKKADPKVLEPKKVDPKKPDVKKPEARLKERNKIDSERTFGD